ncbi:MAG: dihydroorotate dehydrogenase electron transfer subunit [Candidatus Omnitrophota bacterium]|nr:dihydroorotate dehydrogenase electron transfer subunit [Candidatus Omnitrophota bacterium]
MKQLKAKILENKIVAPGFYKICVESPYLAKATKPGQFFKVRCYDSGEPILRRPLGAHSISKNSVEMLYEVVGKGTELLTKKKAGDLLDIIGPLGNGFSLPRSPASGLRSPILIAGGIGVAPLLALAQKIASKQVGFHVIIGAKTKSGILCEKEFKKLGAFVMVSTEDGSKGHKGYATDILKHLLKTIGCQSSGIYACGPHPMLKAVGHISELMHIPCQVSLDERMACGVGVCLGCPVKVKSGGYKMVCKDGPVFDAKEIAW